jgi:K+/H+ antiporter YhaU regulatory subunit KhtT
MQKQFTFSEDEFNKILKEKDSLRKQNSELNKIIAQLEQEIEYMKTEKEDVLVVVKDKEKHDEYVLKTKEKDVLKQLIEINQELVTKNEDFMRELYKINDNLQTSIKENNSLENKAQELLQNLDKKDKHIQSLKDRNLIKRVFNKGLDEPGDDEYISEK